MILQYDPYELKTVCDTLEKIRTEFINHKTAEVLTVEDVPTCIDEAEEIIKEWIELDGAAPYSSTGTVCDLLDRARMASWKEWPTSKVDVILQPIIASIDPEYALLDKNGNIIN